jgi:hypothetical protein
MYDPVAINPCVCPTCDGNRLAKSFFHSLILLSFEYWGSLVLKLNCKEIIVTDNGFVAGYNVV